MLTRYRYSDESFHVFFFWSRIYFCFIARRRRGKGMGGMDVVVMLLWTWVFQQKKKMRRTRAPSGKKHVFDDYHTEGKRTPNSPIINYL